MIGLLVVLRPAQKSPHLGNKRRPDGLHVSLTQRSSWISIYAHHPAQSVSSLKLSVTFSGLAGGLLPKNRRDSSDSWHRIAQDCKGIFAGFDNGRDRGHMTLDDAAGETRPLSPHPATPPSPVRSSECHWHTEVLERWRQHRFASGKQ
jgi:hypothetical protein